MLPCKRDLKSKADLSSIDLEKTFQPAVAGVWGKDRGDFGGYRGSTSDLQGHLSRPPGLRPPCTLGFPNPRATELSTVKLQHRVPRQSTCFPPPTLQKTFQIYHRVSETSLHSSPSGSRPRRRREATLDELPSRLRRPFTFSSPCQLSLSLWSFEALSTRASQPAGAAAAAVAVALPHSLRFRPVLKVLSARKPGAAHKSGGSLRAAG